MIGNCEPYGMPWASASSAAHHRVGRVHLGGGLLLQQLGRGHALPEDVQALFPAVSEHRLVGEADASTTTLAREILHAVAID